MHSAFDRALERALAFDRALANSFALERALYSALYSANERPRALEIDERALAFDLERALVRALVRPRVGDVIFLIETNEWRKALELCKTRISTVENIYRKRQYELLATYLELLLDKDDVIRYRQAALRYLAFYYSLLYIGLENLKPKDYEEERKVFLNAYWYVRIVEARREGHLPAWEGIRLVRERRNV